MSPLKFMNTLNVESEQFFELFFNEVYKLNLGDIRTSSFFFFFLFKCCLNLEYFPTYLRIQKRSSNNALQRFLFYFLF